MMYRCVPFVFLASLKHLIGLIKSRMANTKAEKRKVELQGGRRNRRRNVGSGIGKQEGGENQGLDWGQKPGSHQPARHIVSKKVRKGKIPKAKSSSKGRSI